MFAHEDRPEPSLADHSSPHRCSHPTNHVDLLESVGYLFRTISPDSAVPLLSLSCFILLEKIQGVASSPISSGPTDYLLVITVELVSISSTPAVCHHGGDAAGQAPGPSDAHGHYRRLRVQRGGPRHATGEARHCGRRNVGPCLQLLPLRYGTPWR